MLPTLAHLCADSVLCTPVHAHPCTCCTVCITRNASRPRFCPRSVRWPRAPQWPRDQIPRFLSRAAPHHPNPQVRCLQSHCVHGDLHTRCKEKAAPVQHVIYGHTGPRAALVDDAPQWGPLQKDSECIYSLYESGLLYVTLCYAFQLSYDTFCKCILCGCTGISAPLVNFFVRYAPVVQQRPAMHGLV